MILMKDADIGRSIPQVKQVPLAKSAVLTRQCVSPYHTLSRIDNEASVAVTKDTKVALKGVAHSELWTVVTNIEAVQRIYDRTVR